jgi:PAP2 superfamily
MRLCPAQASTSPDRLASARQTREGSRRPLTVRAIAARPELSLFLAAYLLYDGARWIFAGHLPVARAHAHQIVSLERSLHVAIEGSIQRALDFGPASWLLSNVYLAAQLVVLPAALSWLYRRSRPVYRQLRNTVVTTWLLAVPMFALYPVAPPRLAGIGAADTVSHQAAVALTGRSTLFYNPYAAVPSLHVGFAVAIAIAAAAAIRTPWAKALALLWAPLVTTAVIATGNHYLLDVAVGLLVTVVGFLAGRLISRLSEQRSGARRAAVLTSATRS